MPKIHKFTNSARHITAGRPVLRWQHDANRRSSLAESRREALEHTGGLSLGVCHAARPVVSTARWGNNVRGVMASEGVRVKAYHGGEALAGWLTKKGGMRKNWLKRWFSLNQGRHVRFQLNHTLHTAASPRISGCPALVAGRVLTTANAMGRPLSTTRALTTRYPAGLLTWPHASRRGREYRYCKPVCAQVYIIFGGLTGRRCLPQVPQEQRRAGDGDCHLRAHLLSPGP
jgi:hypothetical protein